ncbi:hypothetical protein AVEN_185892-1 [Araneus ventricosus]|uniref:Peptidase aspartic putative domain-containing protein n=1 Tax=Araneus ventricosus TaxID=182803 RepID=A0A4Y2DHR5_ARAVE|nr:hypothetical protein AVEN_185892-1 [Araneus ventricosus]
MRFSLLLKGRKLCCTSVSNVEQVDQDQKPGLLSECKSKDSGCLFKRANDSNLQVLLLTALINVRTDFGNSVECRAMLDSGIQRSFMTESCWKKTGVEG